MDYFSFFVEILFILQNELLQSLHVLYYITGKSMYQTDCLFMNTHSFAALKYNSPINYNIIMIALYGSFSKKCHLNSWRDYWIFNMIHWSWQTLLLKELLFSNTLQLKCQKTFRSKLWKKEILIFTSITRVIPVNITKAKKMIISFQFSVFFSIIL